MVVYTQRDGDLEEKLSALLFKHSSEMASSTSLLATAPSRVSSLVVTKKLETKIRVERRTCSQATTHIRRELLNMIKKSFFQGTTPKVILQIIHRNHNFQVIYIADLVISAHYFTGDSD